jgi:hypothetical protein
MPGKIKAQSGLRLFFLPDHELLMIMITVAVMIAVLVTIVMLLAPLPVFALLFIFQRSVLAILPMAARGPFVVGALFIGIPVVINAVFGIVDTLGSIAVLIPIPVRLHLAVTILIGIRVTVTILVVLPFLGDYAQRSSQCCHQNQATKKLQSSVHASPFASRGRLGQSLAVT